MCVSVACLRITSYVCFFVVFVLMSIFILTTAGNATAISQQSSPKGGKSSDSVFLSVDITEKFKYFSKASEMSKGLSWWDQQKTVIKKLLSSKIAKKNICKETNIFPTYILLTSSNICFFLFACLSYCLPFSFLVSYLLGHREYALSKQILSIDFFSSFHLRFLYIRKANCRSVVWHYVYQTI